MSMLDDATGEQLAVVVPQRFEVRALLGKGGMGAVYRAYDHEMGGEVALKTMQRPGPDAVLRLKREFRSRAGTIHPNLVQLHDLFVGDEYCFFTMELVEGVDFLRWAQRHTVHSGGPRTLDTRLLGTTLGTLIGPETASLSTRDHRTTASQEAPPRAAFTASASGLAPEGGWDRLRAGFVDLIGGLHALHEAGRVHRDVKPSNVLVTAEDRVVVLDFGLMEDVWRGGEGTGIRGEIVGTPAYMAPEQVHKRPSTPATDLYAAGVMLYQVLTGTLPFSGGVTALLGQKVRLAPAPVHDRAPHAPPDLAALAMELLAMDPERRPTAQACVERLLAGRSSVAPAPPADVRAPHDGRRFVGRRGEIAALAAAFDEVASQRRQVTVHVHGRSGIGKSTLVHELIHAQQAAHHELLALHARCHPQESVPYKAVDAAIDAIAHFLATLPAEQTADLVPPGTYALVRLFPVLGKFPAFRDAPRPPLLPEAIELRQQGFGALRELLARLADRVPVIVWLDDVQWGDIDSAPLLDELVRAPAPPFLLVLTYRSDDRETSPLLRHLEEKRRLEGGSPVVDIALGALPPADVEQLARAFLGERTPGIDEKLRAVIAHAEGNPFIASEVARYLDARDAGLPEGIDAARVVLRRIESLDSEKRSLIEVAAVAGGPIDSETALAVCGLGAAGRPLLAWLRDAHLIRELSGERAVAIGVYHDRIREVVLAALTPSARTDLHRLLAEALSERRSADFEALSIHWEGAGQPRLAGENAVRAADRAAAALAFDHAAALYEKSLTLLGADADRPRLLERLGDVLASRGRAPEAAQRYLDAASAAPHDDLRRINDLKRRAAEQYIKSGMIDDGWREMRSVLDSLRIPIPGSVLGAVGAATWRRVAFLTKRIDVERRTSVPAPPDEQYRMDVLWSATTGWAMINHSLADVFRVMHLLWAVRSGGVATLCRALAYEAAMEFHVGGSFFDRNARKLLGMVESLSARTGDPYDRAWLDLARGNDGYTHGRWRESAEALARADEVFRERCPGSAWERVTVGIFLHHALAMLGDLDELRARLAELRRDAELRGDIYAACEAHINEPVLAWLADDKAGEARERASKALAAQTVRASSWPENAYRRQHYADLVAMVYAGAYTADPWPAWKSVMAQWPALKSAFLLPLRVTGLCIRHARARAALACAATLTGDRTPPPPGIDPRWTREELLADAREQLGIIARDPAGCAAPMAGLLRAALAHQSGARVEAEGALERAMMGFDREEMALYREVARYAWGHVRGGPAGALLVREAESWMAGRSVVKPHSMVAAMAPGLGITGG